MASVLQTRFIFNVPYAQTHAFYAQALVPAGIFTVKHMVFPLKLLAGVLKPMRFSVRESAHGLERKKNRLLSRAAP